jgi:pimeloyl-ACP methyl ester carboxylesterase
VFLGGNGHSTERLEPARRAINELGLPLVIDDAPYPGFENRPRVGSFEEFLDVTASLTLLPIPTIIYGTGIGGLIALSLRARGIWKSLPLLLQAPVLWGLERRLMPRIMRLGLARYYDRITSARVWQNHFARTRFLKPLSPEMRKAFFGGFAQCRCGGDFFDWLTPALLRSLERRHAETPAVFDNVHFWWGARDRVVSLEELSVSNKALRTSFSPRVFAEWGHYPMIDSPGEWVKEVNDAVATIGAIPRPNGPQAE